MFNFSKYEKIILIMLCGALLAGFGFSAWKTRSKAVTPVAAPIGLEKMDLEKTNEIVRNYSVININIASADELERLNGIGPVLAGRIIEYRRGNGLFKDKKSILDVPGIGPKLYEGLERNITVE